MSHFRIYLIVIAAVASGLIGCSSTEEVDLWPLVFYEHDRDKKETRLDLLTFLYSYHDTPQQTTHAARPFFVGEFPKDKELLQLLFLWPFGYLRQEPNDTKVWVLPFYYYRDIERPELGERDFDWFFLPFAAFGGTDTKEGSYLYMTVWGNMKGLLGYDEIKATPFPFYVEARDGAYVTRGYLWPFFRFGEGGGRKFRFYCFMYSSYDWEGKFQRRSYLWPLIHYNKEGLHKKYPRTDFLFFPFYGQSKSEVALSRTILWPFFSYAYDNSSGYRELNCPWPFYKTRSGAGAEELRLWPFYWTYEKNIDPVGQEKDLIVMWPFFWQLHSDYLTYEKDSLYILPFYWQHWRQGKEKGAGKLERIKVWPLLEYRKDIDGTVRYRGLSPLWFDDYVPYGIEKAWLPLITLFDYSTGPEGKKGFTMLGPMYQYKEDQESLYHRLLFFSYKKVHNAHKDRSRFTVLGGLFEYRNEEGQNKLRLFYLPLGSWGEKRKPRPVVTAPSSGKEQTAPPEQQPQHNQAPKK